VLHWYFYMLYTHSQTTEGKTATSTDGRKQYAILTYIKYIYIYDNIHCILIDTVYIYINRQHDSSNRQRQLPTCQLRQWQEMWRDSAAETLYCWRGQPVGLE